MYNDRNKPDDVIRITNLKKQFDDGKIAVNGVNLNLYKGEIFALLGHNGAGKSTMISMLSGLYDSTDGQAVFNNVDILQSENMNMFRSKLGICPQSDVLFDDLTVKEHLSMFAVFKGEDNKEQRENDVNKILKQFDMTSVSDIIAKNLSAGQRRKLSIMIALVGGSEVIFLDEPSSGMDITSRRAMWDTLKNIATDKIIVLTTHFMEEAAVLGKRIGIISDGKMKCVGSPLFLIEKFGKFISINVSKEPTSDNNEIVKFFKENTSEGLMIKVLSEEILFRIPKKSQNGDFDISKFFALLDENVNTLKIKSYSASMPTLEDVFLNVASLEHNNKNKDITVKIVDNDKILFNDDNYNVQRTSFEKFKIDLSVSLKKRILQIVRDVKSFLLEVLCPVLLVLIGVLVSSVDYFSEEKNFVLSPTSILDKQTIYVINDNTLLQNDLENEITVEQLPVSSSTEDKYVYYMNDIYQQNNTENYGSYYIEKIDNINHKYDFVTYVNTQSRQGAIIYVEYMLNHIAQQASDKKIKIQFTNYPIPKTLKEKNNGQERNNATLVFFVAVAFALIPANFITLIIKEREKNTKHLQIISGISLISYWFSNFIFELVKYYFTGGINLIIIYLFDFFPSYFYVLYLLYGPSMVSFTYLFSFIFSNESSAQNTVILMNFLFGALAGAVVLILRVMDNVVTIGKVLSYIFRLVPTFCFCYGYNELLTENNLLYIDQPTTWMTLKKNTIISLKYVGADCLYMSIETILFLVLLTLFEMKQSGLIFNENDNNEKNVSSVELVNINNNVNNINDSQVMKEIDRANDSNTNYAIAVQRLTKNYYKGYCGGEYNTALKDISFCLEYGECFGFLGINGAGKTTTFKCLTNEIVASKGNISINGKNIKTHFNEVRSLIGYCPQFDAIFEYMTVYENLEFYAKIKGIVESQMKNIITALMEEMNLIEYKDKISGNLSGGNKRKLSVSIAMICNPAIVLLDEPSTGMDPEARRFMWSVIHKISTRSKKSSVIMTTHSMEEAETLCRRIGILVNGSFKCMGSSNYIKEKYGEGYEINLQIAPMTEENIDIILSKCEIDGQLIVREDNVTECLQKIGRDSFINEFISKDKESIAWKLKRDMKENNGISIVKLITWCNYITNALHVVNKIREHYKVITLSDYVDNNFVFKIKKTNATNEKSIGFLFGIVEHIRSKYDISEYSIQQTSLEQIFNKFASEDNNCKVGSNSINIDDKIDVEINSVILKDLLLIN